MFSTIRQSEDLTMFTNTAESRDPDDSIILKILAANSAFCLLYTFPLEETLTLSNLIRIQTFTRAIAPSSCWRINSLNLMQKKKEKKVKKKKNSILHEEAKTSSMYFGVVHHLIAGISYLRIITLLSLVRTGREERSPGRWFGTRRTRARRGSALVSSVHRCGSFGTG